MIKTKHTQAELAKLLGVSQGTISYWLSGQVRPAGLSREVLRDKMPELLKKIDDEWDRLRDGRV